jgi:ATP-dependent DNA helicase Rep
MLADLNPQQREAVKYLDGPLLVLAGAGSGKTRVITRKIAYLVTQCGIEARHIAAITFTNKAAREMRERVGELLPGKQGQGLTVSTFHSLGLSILRAEARRLGYKPRFSVLDAADANGILSDILKNPDKAGLRQAASVISNWKNALLSPAEALRAAEDEAQRQTAVAYQALPGHPASLPGHGFRRPHPTAGGAVPSAPGGSGNLAGPPALFAGR